MNVQRAFASSPALPLHDPSGSTAPHLVRTAPPRKKKLAASGPLRRSFDHPLCMAFQPIVNVRDQTAFAYEALVRGEYGEGAETVMRHVTKQNHFAFDNACRKQSMVQASALGMQNGAASLALNVSPDVVRSPNECVDRTLELAEKLHFPLSRIILEIAEHDPPHDQMYLNHLVRKFRGYGIRTAIDDFGRGPSGPEMLEECEANIVKIAMSVVRDLDRKPPNCVVVESIVQMARRLDMQVIAEGVETAAEYEQLCRMGVYLMQGYYFAPPALSRLPDWKIPEKTWKSFQTEEARMSPCPSKQPPTQDKAVA
jgi:EAL domain-containing protein (putative c-di-GMP-specific phosphodiesterase class I)